MRRRDKRALTLTPNSIRHIAKLSTKLSKLSGTSGSHNGKSVRSATYTVLPRRDAEPGGLL